MPTLSPTEISTQVRQVYTDLAARPIERACDRLGECCRFRLTGRTPFLTKAEALVAARAYRATGRTKLRTGAPVDGACPMLNEANGKCLIYADRPFGCRTHFCAAAGGPYGRREVVDLIHRLEDLSLQAGGREAQSLEVAVREALAALP